MGFHTFERGLGSVTSKTGRHRRRKQRAPGLFRVLSDDGDYAMLGGPSDNRDSESGRAAGAVWVFVIFARTAKARPASLRAHSITGLLFIAISLPSSSARGLQRSPP